jgi:hypothetical protein
VKSRKELPNFGYLDNIHLDMNKILSHLEINDLLNYDKYNDIKYSSESDMQSFVVANKFSKNSFFKESTAESLEGEMYKQLYLTKFDNTKSSKKNLISEKTTIYSRTKRLNSNSKIYLPEADELNYGIKTDLVKGVLDDILKLFESKITRVRLALLKPNFSIKPHVDYDPSYIMRYHLPLITNEKCLMHVICKNVEYNIHFPADGRIFFLNSGHKHWVSNNSNENRLHLIIDVHGQKELNNIKNFE